MEENKNSGFWDLVIWVTLLGGGTFALAGLICTVVGDDWVKLALCLLGLGNLLRDSIAEKRNAKKADGKKPAPVEKAGPLRPGEAARIVSGALTFFPIIFLPGISASSTAKPLLLLASLPLMIVGLLRIRRKTDKEARKAEEEQREPLALRDRLARSARSAFIVCSHAREVDLTFELDDRMFLYSLPDGRFLVLFRKDVPLDAFLGSLSDFRSEVDADEDAIGCYGLPHDGPRPDFPLVFVCSKEGESRPFDFNPSTVPISAAVPV